MAKIADQALQRRYQYFRDQHNRSWGSNVEITTGHPTGSWDPHFIAPIMPEPKYIRIDNKRPGRILIDYDAWVRDLREAHQGYINKGKRYGFEKYGKLFDPTAPFTEEILQFVGPAPKPVEPILAARSNNRWVLGLLGPNGEIPVMPEKLAPFFIKPEPYREAIEDEFAEDGAATVDEEPPAPTVTNIVYATKPQLEKRKVGRPTNAERAARQAAMAAEE